MSGGSEILSFLIDTGLISDDSERDRELIDRRNDEFMTPLHVAACVNNHRFVKRWIEAFPNTINSIASFNSSPLLLAIENNHYDSAKILIKHGAFIYDPSYCFKVAKAHNSEGIIKLIKQHKELYKEIATPIAVNARKISKESQNWCCFEIGDKETYLDHKRTGSTYPQRRSSSDEIFCSVDRERNPEEFERNYLGNNLENIPNEDNFIYLEKYQDGNNRISIENDSVSVTDSKNDKRKLSNALKEKKYDRMHRKEAYLLPNSSEKEKLGRHPNEMQTIEGRRKLHSSNQIYETNNTSRPPLLLNLHSSYGIEGSDDSLSQSDSDNSVIEDGEYNHQSKANRPHPVERSRLQSLAVESISGKYSPIDPRRIYYIKPIVKPQSEKVTNTESEYSSGYYPPINSKYNSRINSINVSPILSVDVSGRTSRKSLFKDGYSPIISRPGSNHRNTSYKHASRRHRCRSAPNWNHSTQFQRIYGDYKDDIDYYDTYMEHYHHRVSPSERLRDSYSSVKSPFSYFRYSSIFRSPVRTPRASRKMFTPTKLKKKPSFSTASPDLPFKKSYFPYSPSEFANSSRDRGKKLKSLPFRPVSLLITNKPREHSELYSLLISNCSDNELISRIKELRKKDNFEEMVKYRDLNGRTPLILAIIRRNKEIIELLDVEKYTMEDQNECDCTECTLAEYWSNYEIDSLFTKPTG